MSQDRFNHQSYGLLRENELSVTLQLARAKKTTNTSTKRPGVIERTDIEFNPQHIQASLEFENISARDINILSRLWFMRLQVFLNEKIVSYSGPMVSMGPPTKNDFVTLAPGEKFVTKPTILNQYYKLSDDFKGTLRVTYRHSPQVPESVATFAN